jgi:hypothetical protein
MGSRVGVQPQPAPADPYAVASALGVRNREVPMKVARLFLLLCCGAVLLAVGAGCAKKAALPDAFYAGNMVPLYPHAELRDQMGGHSSGDGPEANWDDMAWFMNSKDDPAKIVAFYDARLTGWQKETDENGDTKYETAPEGASEGEHVYVVIHPNGEIQIGESVKSGKKKHAES